MTSTSASTRKNFNKWFLYSFKHKHICIADISCLNYTIMRLMRSSAKHKEIENIEICHIDTLYTLCYRIYFFFVIFMVYYYCCILTMYFQKYITKPLIHLTLQWPCVQYNVWIVICMSIWYVEIYIFFSSSRSNKLYHSIYIKKITSKIMKLEWLLCHGMYGILKLFSYCIHKCIVKSILRAFQY